MTETNVPGGFRQKLVQAAQLSSLTFASQILLRLVSIAVLTRLLAPDVYGVFAIVATYILILKMISDLGVRSVVLTHDGSLDEAFLGTCLSVGVGRGIVIACLSYVLAIGLSALAALGTFSSGSAYAAPELPLALAAVGTIQILVGFVSPNLFVREGKMSFGRAAILDVSGNAFGLTVTILVAFALESIWALVIGTLASESLRVILSHALFKGVPLRLRWDRPAAIAIFSRGRWIAGQSTLSVLAQAADRLVLGFLLDASNFGFYYIARQFVDIGVGFLNTLHWRIGLQTFTHVLKAPAAEIRRNYYRYRLVFDGLSGLAAGGLVTLAPILVGVLFDDRYAGVAPMLSIIALSLLLIGPSLLREAYSAQRKFKPMTFLSIVSTALIWVGLGAAIWTGSLQLALYVIALYRLPEVVILWVLGWRNDWVRPLFEVMPLVFFTIGAGVGYLVKLAWAAYV